MFKKILSFIGSLFSWLGNIVVKAPKCKGPDAGVVGGTVMFTVKSGYEKLSDDYLYSFDWGDGNPPTELEEGKKLRKETGTLGKAHVFKAAGVYNVRVREKCPLNAHDHWSKVHQITIK
jgi:hypothetical protein